MNQQFSLRWNNYFTQVTDAFGFLRTEEDLVDVTLSCEGKKIKAHKMLLSACSPYFQDVFKENPCKHPVIVFRNVKHEDLLAIIDFMYRGEVNVLREQLESFLSTAELLEVRGLTDGCGSEMSQLDLKEHSICKKPQSTSTPDPFTPSRSSEAHNEPIVSYSPATSKPRSPPLKKRKYNQRSSQLKPENKTNPFNDLSKTTPEIPKIEKIETIEDLTFDDDEDDLNCQVGSEDVTHSFQPEISQGFTTNTISLDELQNSNDNLDQTLVGGPGTLMEGVSQDTIQATKLIIEEKDNKQCLNHGERKQENEGKEPNAESCGGPEDLRPTGSEQNENVIKIKDSLNQDLKKMSPKNDKSIGKLHIPSSLTVTVLSQNEEEIEEDISSNAENVQSSEDDVILRSEEAKTPFQEENISASESTKTIDQSSSSGLFNENDSEMAAEAPILETEEIHEEKEGDVVQEEKEPEFDYYGCQTCKAEGKPVSDQFNFTHKCPICPCLCFCSHLLKEHMRYIHGWFNVRRSFKQY